MGPITAVRGHRHFKMAAKKKRVAIERRAHVQSNRYLLLQHVIVRISRWRQRRKWRAKRWRQKGKCEHWRKGGSGLFFTHMQQVFGEKRSLVIQ